jgi:pilus assembly protein CpaB
MRRALGILGAVAIAAFGAFLLIGYVRGAEDRALEGEELVEVLVVDSPVAKGTPAGALSAFTRVERVPSKVQAEGAVSDIESLEDLVASTDLLPGEQIVSSRFVALEVLNAAQGIEPPAGTLEVTIALSPERSLGGAVKPGDTVAVIASFEPFNLNTIEPSELAPGEVIDPSEIFLGSTDEEGRSSVRTPESTHLILHDVVITNIQVEQLPTVPDDEEVPEGTPALAPTGNLLVTLAAQPGDVERLVFTAEHGFIWLAAGEEGLPEPTDVSIITRETIYR